MARRRRAGRDADRLASAAPAGPDRLFLRLGVRLVGRGQVCPALVPRAPRPRGRLVHGARRLHAAVPITTDRIRLDDSDDVVGRRPRGLDVLDRDGPRRRRAGRVAGHVGPPRREARLRGRPSARHPADGGDGPDDGPILPARRAMAGVRDAGVLVRARGHDLHLHADAHAVAGARRPRRRRADPTGDLDSPVVLPAPPDHGQLRLRPGARRRRQEAGAQVHHPDRPGRDLRHVLRGDVPLPRDGRRHHALDRPADGRQVPSRARLHAERGDVWLGGHSRHDVVPVRPVRDAAAPRRDLAAADGDARGSAGEGHRRARLVAGALRGFQEGDRLAPRAERPAPRVSRPACHAPHRRRAELRHGPGDGPAGLQPAVQEPEGGDGDPGGSRRIDASAAEKAGRPVSPARSLTLALLAGGLLATSAMAQPTPTNRLRESLFVGVDTSGSFVQTGDYGNAMTFLSYYLYGHLNGLGGLSQPRELFVAAIGGKEASEPKAFHPILDFAGKDLTQIEADLKRWYAPTDTLTDFNVFFNQVARIAKDRNLVMSPITVLLVTDGVPDVPVPGVKPGSSAMYQRIDLGPLEYLSRNLTVRLIYPNPKVGELWRKQVPRQRVKLWTTESEVMKGWRAQLVAGVDPGDQTRLWKWVRDNVDFRVRLRPL